MLDHTVADAVVAMAYYLQQNNCELENVASQLINEAAAHVFGLSVDADAPRDRTSGSAAVKSVVRENIGKSTVRSEQWTSVHRVACGV